MAQRCRSGGTGGCTAVGNFGATRIWLRYAEPVEHDSGISPTTLMFLCFIVVGLGSYLVLYFDKNKRKK